MPLGNCPASERATTSSQRSSGCLARLAISSATSLPPAATARSCAAYCSASGPVVGEDRKSTRLNSSHTVIYTLSLHDALPIWMPGALGDLLGDQLAAGRHGAVLRGVLQRIGSGRRRRSEEHTSELQSHSDLHSFPTRRSSDLDAWRAWRSPRRPACRRPPRRGPARRTAAHRVRSSA